MREELGLLGSDRRYTFTGVVGRFGTKKGFKGYPLPTIMLMDIKMDDTPVTDHLWMNMTKGFVDADLEMGDTVRFDARVNIYEKGYKGHRSGDWIFRHPIELDYGLERPTHVEVIKRKEKE